MKKNERRVRMLKKVFGILVLIALLSINGYQLYTLQNTSRQIEVLDEQLEAHQNEEEYISLYEELTREIGDVSNIEDKIGLLRREYQQNDEGLTLSMQDLERIKNQNNEIEEQIIKIELQKKEEEEKRKLYESFPTFNQFPNYPTGCESVALYLLLRYHGVNVNVEEIVSSLKKGPLPYENNGQKLGGNPEVEFIGDPKTKYSYGVYNKPIVEVANQYKSGVVSKIGLDFSEVLKLVQEKHPVMVWTTINLSKPFISTTWVDYETGDTIQWISGEHAVVIFEVEDSQVVVSDPYTGTIRKLDQKTFESRYNYLGKRAIYYE